MPDRCLELEVFWLAEAVQLFNQDSVLAYNWLSYLPQGAKEVEDPFFKDMLSKIFTLLGSSKCLVAASAGLEPIALMQPLPRLQAYGI